MRGICGWFSDRPEDDGGAALRSMLATNAPAAAGATLRSSPGAGLAAFGAGAGLTLTEFDGLLLAVVGHPRLRTGGASSADPADLARALKRDPREALARVGGDFALAAWDRQERRGYLAVDRIGVHQLVYTRINGALVFASTLDLLGAFPGVRRELSSQGLFDYLFYHVSPGPQTVFADQHRVPPGHCLEFGPRASVQPQAYWSMRFSEEPGLRLDALEEEFRSLLSGAVAEASEGAATGAFLSGGTDSSTISGMLSKLRSAPARTFSIGFDVAGFDEMEYARLAARHFGCEHHEYYVTPKDVVDAVPMIAASYDQPFGNASAIPTYYCARFAREHGIARLLAGDGGDELFGGNERYAKQHLLGMYQHIPAPLRRFLIEPLLLASTPLHRVPPLSKLRSYIEQARPPMPQRYESYNLLNHLGVGNVFEPDFLASIDTRHPHQLMAEAHAPFADASLVNQMMAIDLRFILADGDLPKVTRMCELADVDVAFPLLDDRLVEFSQGLSADLKLRGTQLRWFFKHALKDFLPREIITKQKHGFGLPVGAWLVGHPPLRALAVDGIAILRKRGIVQSRFCDDLLANKLPKHPAYYGTMVWVLMMLGLWLDSRKL